LQDPEEDSTDVEIKEENPSQKSETPQPNCRRFLKWNHLDA